MMGSFIQRNNQRLNNHFHPRRDPRMLSLLECHVSPDVSLLGPTIGTLVLLLSLIHPTLPTCGYHISPSSQPQDHLGNFSTGPRPFAMLPSTQDDLQGPILPLCVFSILLCQPQKDLGTHHVPSAVLSMLQTHFPFSLTEPWRVGYHYGCSPDAESEAQ